MGDSSQSPLSSTEVAYQWILKFAAITGKVAERIQQDIWVEALSDIPAHRLNAACKRLMESWRLPNLPLPGDVRAQLEGADDKAFKLTAEAEWQKLLSWIRDNYFLDIGIRCGAPRLSPAVEHAARAAGGYHFLERCSEEELVWARKTFLATYKNVHETGQVEHLLGNGEAKKILGRLTAGPKPQIKPLPPVKAESSESGIPREEVSAVLHAVAEAPAPVAELPTEEEWQARKDRLKKSALDWAASHGIAVSPSEQSELINR